MLINLMHPCWIKVLFFVWKKIVTNKLYSSQFLNGYFILLKNWSLWHDIALFSYEKVLWNYEKKIVMKNDCILSDYNVSVDVF